MHYRRRPKVPARAPVLVLNADAVPTIDRLIWGEAMTAVEITAERHVHVAQLASSRCSAHALLDDGGAPERLGRVERALAREARGGRRVLAVCTKRVRCEITGEDRDQRLPPYVRLDRLAGERLDGVVHLAHFHALRGLDRWKDFDTVVIIGREQPPPLAIEARARALFGDDAEPLELPGRYVEEERDIVTRAGRRHRVRVQVHPDPRVQLLLELERERESLQVIDRLRPVWAETPKRVVLLSNLPLPGLPVDELVTWADLTGDRLDAILEAEGALPLSAVHLSAAFPSLFATAKAAEHAIFRRPDLHAELHPQSP